MNICVMPKGAQCLRAECCYSTGRSLFIAGSQAVSAGFWHLLLGNALN